MVGKYVSLTESYKSLSEALTHAGIHTKTRVNIQYVDAEAVELHIRDFFKALKRQFPTLPLVLVNPLAEGGDMLVAKVALDMGIPLTLIAAFLTIEGDAPEDESLRAHCAEHLADYKIPKIFEIIDELPRNPNGKLKRKALISAHRRDR